MECGMTMVRGAQRAHGIFTTRERIIDSMRHLDLLSQIIRRRVTTYRRRYSVLTPNSLW